MFVPEPNSPFSVDRSATDMGICIWVALPGSLSMIQKALWPLSSFGTRRNCSWRDKLWRIEFFHEFWLGPSFDLGPNSFTLLKWIQIFRKSCFYKKNFRVYESVLFKIRMTKKKDILTKSPIIREENFISSNPTLFSGFVRIGFLTEISAPLIRLFFYLNIHS